MDEKQNVVGDDFSVVVGGIMQNVTGGDTARVVCGFRSKATIGYNGIGVCGDESVVRADDRSTVFIGRKCRVEIGENGLVVGRIGAKVKAGLWTAVILEWQDWDRPRYLIGFVGEEILPGKWYKVEAGRWVETDGKP